jgi:hypothetical protein
MAQPTKYVSPSGGSPVPFPTSTASTPPSLTHGGTALNHRGATIPLNDDNDDDNNDHVSQQASAVRDNIVKYNPKMDPKFDASHNVKAQAFTSGNNIHLDPRVGKGQSLVGHELTHVVQQ